MSIHVALNHVTHYRYDRLEELSPQILRLRPAPHCRTRILAYSLKVMPADHFINWQQDPQANYLARLVFPDATREFRVEVGLVAEMSVQNPFDFFLAPHAETVPFKYDSNERRELVSYLVKAPATPLMTAYLAGVPQERLVIKPAYPNQSFEAVFARDLAPAARASLRQRMVARPHAYVAQEQLAFSRAPVWRDGVADAGAGTAAASASARHGFGSRALGIRVYAIATPSGYRVMPGGLARIAPQAAEVVSMQRGGGSKDVWVLAADQRSTDDAGHSSAAPRAIARHDELPSRLAENLFWMGRYSERCEDKARLLRATLGTRANGVLWPQALATCRHFITLSNTGEATQPMFDAANPLGLKAEVQRLAWCASQARSRLSAENWRAVSALQRQLQDAVDDKRDPRETFDVLLLALAGLAGFALDDMTQDDGWRLMMLGRRLERMQFLAELLAQRLQSGATPTQSELEWLLDIGDSTFTYRSRYLASPRLGPVIDLLVFDKTNPRALAYQWNHIEYSLVRIAASLGGTPDVGIDEAVAVVAQMELSAVEGDSARAVRARQALAEHLAALVSAAGALSDRLALKHFTLIDVETRTVAA